MRRGLAQDTIDQRAIGEAEHEVEIPARVERVCARVWPAENGDGAARLKQAAQRVGELRRFSKAPNENNVDVGRELVFEALESRIADIRHAMPALLAPDADGLRHD